LNTSVEAPESLHNATLRAYTSVLSKASEPMGWLKQSIKQRNDILKITDEDNDESTLQYFVDYFCELLF
jgi:hypothetical protein